MYVKKSISLLLSGALFASLCTGCSQTTMEHHFFTDTDTVTEQVTEVVENSITPKIKKLEEILGDDFEFDVVLSPYTSVSTVSDPVSSKLNSPFLSSCLVDKVTSETLSDWILKKNAYLSYAFYCGEYDDEIGLNEFLNGVNCALDKLCNIFDNLDETARSALKNHLLTSGFNESPQYLQLGVGIYKDNDANKYYIVALLQGAGEVTLAWK